VGSVFDVSVTQLELQSSSVVSGVREEMPASMAQHVGMGVRQPRSFPSALDHLADVGSGRRPATFTGKHKRSGSGDAAPLAAP